MNVRSALLLIGFFLLVSRPTWAQGTGVQLYESGEYEVAIRQCEQELAEASRAPAERAQARIYLAASLHALGQAAEARKQLELLAREHPEVRVDPILFPPELVTLAEAIREQAESTREFEAREAQLRQEREEALRRASPTPLTYLRPEALGLFEAVARTWTLGAGASIRRESLEGSIRVLYASSPAFHLQVGVSPGQGSSRFLLGLRASLVPGLDSYGTGPVVGGRIALPGGLIGLAEVGAEYFFAGREDHHRFAVMAQVGLGYDVRLQ